ncbi:MAG: restriction endonuclease [Phycisphaerales bacterium]|jgi:hypothetical protein
MLSATDVHYLMGLLTSVSTPESVEIMLGDFVHDAGIDKCRDVDVTVTYKDADGLISAFKGIEVKKHSRPLDVTHVEQLVAKFNDMSDISHRAIVSASGYTQSALKKAEAHGVDLFSLIHWDNPMEGFEHIRFPPGFFIKQRTLIWVDRPRIAFNPNEHIPDQVRNQITNQSHIRDSDGERDSTCKTVQDSSRRVSQAVLRTVIDQEPIKSMAPGTEMNVKYLSRKIGDFYLDLEESKLHLHEALIEGNVKWIEKSVWPEFKVLVKEGELSPYVGCAIAELSHGNLIGFTVSQVDRSLKLINIPLSDRNQKKIRLHKLR